MEIGVPRLVSLRIPLLVLDLLSAAILSHAGHYAHLELDFADATRNDDIIQSLTAKIAQDAITGTA